MPIYVYECPEGHRIEFLKLARDEVEPRFCTWAVSRKQDRTGAIETFVCGLPLEKIITGVNWKWTRGKNPKEITIALRAIARPGSPNM